MNPEIPATAPVRFDCPACGAVLTVPAAAAGLQGPCPKCWKEIVSPDPALGLPARLPALPPVPPPAEDLVPAIPAPPPDPAPAIPAPEIPTIPAEPASSETPTAPTASEPAPEPPAALTPDPESPLTPPAAAAPKSGKAGWVLTLLVFSLAFAAVGYHFGKSQRPPEPAPLSPAPAPAAPPKPAAPDPEPVPEPEPLPDPPAPEDPPKPTASGLPSPEATLRSFLEAPDWKTRGARVLSPDEILPAMEKYAAQAGDGPIATTSVTLIGEDGSNHIFKVSTPAIPEGFPVAVSATEEGPMIDWESFIGFHDDHFRKFLEGPTGRSGIFDLLVKPEPEQAGDNAAYFVSYRLSVPMPGRETVAWIPKETVALARLRAIFDGSGGFDKATVERLAETGIPLVLALEKKLTNDGRDFIEIKDVVAIGWGPPAP